MSKANSGKRVPVVTDSKAAQSLLLGEGKYGVVVKVGDLTGEVPFDIDVTRDTKLTVMLKPH